MHKNDIDASAEAVEQIARIVKQLSARWPHTRTLLRADSDFAREASFSWSMTTGAFHLFDLARKTDVSPR